MLEAVQREWIPSSKLETEIELARKLGATSKALRVCFGSTAENLRKIRERARKYSRPQAPPGIVLSAWETVSSECLHTYQTDEVRALRAEIEKSFDQAANENAFLEGVENLKALLPRIGNLKDIWRRRAFARIHQHIAWLQSHTGLTLDSYQSAVRAMDQYGRAFERDSKNKQGLDIRFYIETALVKALALRQLKYPKLAEVTLDNAETLAKTAKLEVGSEHYRQRATIYLRSDPVRAKYYFDLAQTSHYENAVHEDFPLADQLITKRQLNLLDQDWDDQMTFLEEIKKYYSSDHQQTIVNTTWTAACGLSLDDPAVDQDVMELLIKDQPHISSRINQATIRQLLLLTPELGLKALQRAEWIKIALSANIFSGGQKKFSSIPVPSS